MKYSQRAKQNLNLSLSKYGLNEGDLHAELSNYSSIQEKLFLGKSTGSMPFLSLPDHSADLSSINLIAGSLRERFDRLVIFGVGGSSLGGRALVGLTGADLGNQAPIFMDASDPYTFETVLSEIPLERTGFLVVSKSGATLETLMQTLLALENTPTENFVFITEPGDNPLRRIGQNYGIELLDHDPKLVGRYSVMSMVGLIPAAYSGIDIQAVRNGAKGVLKNFFDSKDPYSCAPAMGAAATVAFSRKGVGINVLMPYADRLRGFAHWHRQLWAESLGKKGFGMTPIVARGPADQHSQLQLYLDGPADKLFTIILVKSINKGQVIGTQFSPSSEMPWLEGKSISNLNQALAEATTETLINHHRPVRKIILSTVDAQVMGELMMHFMLETIIAAEILGIDPFDQPAVENIKISAKSRMGGPSL